MSDTKKTPPKIFPVSWDELHRNSKALSWRLLELGPWKGIIAVARGGLIPAGIIARELEIHHVESFCIASYENEYTQGDAKTLKNFNAPNDGEGWLIIDDLVDSGKTAEIVKKANPKAHLATIYAKPMGKPQVDTFITEVSQDTWIYFPWEVDQAYSDPIAESKK